MAAAILLSLVPGKGPAQQVDPLREALAEIPAAMRPAVASGRSAAEGRSVTDYTAVATIGAAPIGFVVTALALGADLTSAVYAILGGSVAFTIAWLSFAGRSPDEPVPADALPQGLRSAERPYFELGYQERFRELRRRAAWEGAGYGIIAGSGLLVLLSLLYPST